MTEHTMNYWLKEAARLELDLVRRGASHMLLTQYRDAIEAWCWHAANASRDLHLERIAAAIKGADDE